jgi:hypothetical protein
VTLIVAILLLMEYTGNSRLHSSLPYIVVSLLAPIPLAVASRATGIKYAASTVAAIYTACLIGFILILPLFPAQPKLGPVYQNVTHFIPPDFPLLLIIPALALDLFWQRARNWNAWLLAFVSGLIFTGVLLAVEWPFANFLMSPPSRNWFFGTNYFWYGLPATSFSARHLFYMPETGWPLIQGLVIALLFATASIRFALSRGQWMSEVKR